jgi:hypothetical protein
LTRRSLAKYCSDKCNKKASDKRCAPRVKKYLAGYYEAHKGPSTRPPRKHESEQDRNLKKKYGISMQTWREIREAQGGKCGLCGDPIGDKPGHNTHLDHCHETGTVRGILCNRCNTGLGAFGDNISNLEAAIRYLNEANMGGNARGAA